MDAIIILLLIVVVILTIFSIVVSFYCYKTNKIVNIIFEKGNITDFKDILIKQKEKNANLEEEIKKAFLEIKDLQKISRQTIQKVSVIRFNPFNEIGGNQSFVIALLDNKNNGFVISSLFVNEGSRVYSKTIKAGKSDHKLSREEVEAVNKAIKDYE
jgi:predicted PurR-regulated permease PerM